MTCGVDGFGRRHYCCRYCGEVLGSDDNGIKFEEDFYHMCKVVDSTVGVSCKGCSHVDWFDGFGTEFCSKQIGADKTPTLVSVSSHIDNDTAPDGCPRLNKSKKSRNERSDDMSCKHEGGTHFAEISMECCNDCNSTLLRIDQQYLIGEQKKMKINDEKIIDMFYYMPDFIISMIKFSAPKSFNAMTDVVIASRKRLGNQD